jgi:hypothetical protein
MSNDQHQHRSDDAVLGGQSPPPVNAVVLGGLEGVKQRLLSESDQVKIAALKDALKYGTAGLKLLEHIIQTETGPMRWMAYKLVLERAHQRQPENLANDSPKVVLPQLTAEGMVRRLRRGIIHNVILVSGELAITCATSGTALFNLSSGETLWEIDCPARCGAISPDSTLLALGWNRNIYVYIHLWHLGTWTALGQLQGHTSPVRCVAFSPDGKLLASGGDKTVRLWDVASSHLVRLLEGHRSWVKYVAFSPDGKLLASSEYRRVRLWDVASGHLVQHLEAHTSWVSCVAFSPDGKLLASSGDITVQLWDIASGHRVGVLEGHTNWVNCLAFSPDGKVLVSGSEDKTVRLWDVASGHLVQLIEGHTYPVDCVAFSPDGKLLASGSIDGAVQLSQVTR